MTKHHQHRHIKIKKVHEINLSDNLTFVQEYIPEPLLIDGHKFDIGVYTIITSVNPLRVYIYSGDILFRYCPQKYFPFNPAIVDKYVVGDDYIPTWEMPSLSHYYNVLNFGMKSSFDALLRSKGKDPEKIWNQVEEAVRLAILSKETLISGLAQKYKNRQNFFEMARFDLIVDKHFKVWLMEANMSPNLSSAHFKQNFLLYEALLYSLLKLVGVGNFLPRDSFKSFDQETEMMISSDKNIMVNGEICGQLPCTESCAPSECQLCKPCLSKSEIAELHQAYREHIYRGDTKRIFPVRFNDPEKTIEDEFFKSLSYKNQMMTKWFQAKCKENKDWC